MFYRSKLIGFYLSTDAESEFILNNSLNIEFILFENSDSFKIICFNSSIITYYSNLFFYSFFVLLFKFKKLCKLLSN